MKFTKLISILLCVALCFTVLSGCGNSGSGNATGSGAPSTNTQGKIELEVGGSGTGTYIYSLSVAIAEIVNKSSDRIFMNVQETAGSMANYPLMTKGEIQVGTGLDSFDHAALKGEPPFDAAAPTVRSLMVATYPVGQFLVPANSGIKTMSDLSGKKVAVGQRGSPTSTMVENTFNALGVQAEFVFSTAAEMSELYKDGNCDAVAYFSGVPNSNFLDMLSAKESHFISMSQAEVDKLSSMFNPYVLTSDVYSTIASDVQTVSDVTTLIISSEIPDDVVYELTKTIWENWDKIVESLPAAGSISIEDTVSLKCPIHPGALKYYKEVNAPLDPSQG